MKCDLKITIILVCYATLLRDMRLLLRREKGCVSLTHVKLLEI